MFEMPSKEELFMYAILVIILAVSFTIILKLSTPITIDLNGRSITEPSPIKGDIEEFMIVAERFATNHEYNRTGYNCINFSLDLKQITDALGFKTKVIQGCPLDQYLRNKSCHYWLRLEVDFEPQTALFTDYSIEFPIQEVIK